jgi:drug/metabolite transporter (DMT)-like permease
MCSDHTRGFVLVTAAGVIWGGGALVAKLMRDPREFMIEYLCTRCACIAALLLAYLIYRAPATLSRLFGVGGGGSALLQPASILGMAGIGVAMAGFIISLALVPAANTLCILAAMPFMTALLVSTPTYKSIGIPRA